MGQKIERDHQRFKKLVRGKVKSNLSKYISRGEMIGTKGKEQVVLSLTSNELPIGDAIVKFAVTIDRDEDGMWIVECPSISGCVSQGSTKEAALENVCEAIRLCLEVRAERGMPLTVETCQVVVNA